VGAKCNLSGFVDHEKDKLSQASHGTAARAILAESIRGYPASHGWEAGYEKRPEGAALSQSKGSEQFENVLAGNNLRDVS
jgi:hypothetical protein